MITDTYSILELLNQYGHMQRGGQRQIANLHDMDIGCQEARGAIESYQEWYADEYGTDDIGALLSVPRCGHSDFAIEGQEAIWPESCRNLSTSYRMNLSGLTDSQIERLWIEADSNWSKLFNVDFTLRNDAYPNTNIYAFEAALGGNVLADQFLATGSCSFRSRGRFDNRNWSEPLFVATCTHEHGHALGLSHVRDSAATMYAGITQASMARRGAPNSSDQAAMLRGGYKRRTKPDPDPDPKDDLEKLTQRFDEYFEESLTRITDLEIKVEYLVRKSTQS